MIFSAFVGVAVLPVSFFFQTSAFSISASMALLIGLNGWLYLVAVLPYLKALRSNDVAATIPIFQTIPVFSFVLGYFFLGEALSASQIIGGLLVILGAIIISFEVQEEKKVKLRKDTLFYMLLASFIYAFHFFLFKAFAVDADFWTTVFWESIGFVMFGLLIVFFMKSYRTEFLNVMKTNAKPVISLNTLNEILNIVAKLLFNYATLSIALALAWVAVGFQPVFVLFYSIVLAIFFPKISNEKVLGKHLVQKIAALAVMLLGTYIIYL